MKRSRPNKSNPLTGHALQVPVLADEASLSTLRGHTGLLSRAWEWLRARQVTRSNTRRLRVAETVSLGEKRFVAVVQVDGRHFLLAGGPTNIALLAQLDTQENFGEVLKKTLTTTPSKQVAKHKRPANAVMRAQVNLTSSPEVAPQTPVTARTRQRAKRSSRQDPFPQGTPSAPPVTHLNGTKTFGDAGGQQGNHVGEQNSNSTTAQRGYFA
jgi:flagellar biogenesis protein FliO